MFLRRRLKNARYSLLDGTCKVISVHWSSSRAGGVACRGAGRGGVRGGAADSGAGASAPSEKGHCGGPGVVSAVTSRAGADNLPPAPPRGTYTTRRYIRQREQMILKEISFHVICYVKMFLLIVSSPSVIYFLHPVPHGLGRSCTGHE
ncbi:hypothetical protein PYW07_014423 [Mythimna separata]|uniref:Uncharacterized protein n=1 Tax=Mythimna separata TaxID=271217 RepID=A0AAD7Z198_MYTSE|nr:hypothetical protein PYW07_014423 [Mythimna separata]